VGRETRTGCLELAAVEGLRSWWGEGARFMEPVWIVSAMRMGREEAVEDILASWEEGELGLGSVEWWSMGLE
jgi:hypothetical protein